VGAHLGIPLFESRSVCSISTASRLMVISMPPQGLEQVSKIPGKTNGKHIGGNISRDLAELVELWPNLSVEVRQACLELAHASNRSSKMGRMD